MGFASKRHFICAAILAALSAMSAHAGPKGTLNQSVTTGGALPKVAGKPAPKADTCNESDGTCGIAISYHRANDNLTMQALYLVTKIQKIDGAIQNKKDDDARTAMGAFCKDANEDIKDCFKRYQAFQGVALLNIRQAIGTNEDTIAHLTYGRKEDGTVSGTAVVYSNGLEKTPYLPQVPTVAELEQSYLEGNLKPKGAAYTPAEIKKWSMELVDPRRRPNIEFGAKPVDGNPYQQDEKNSYSLYMQDSGGNGGSRVRVNQVYNKALPQIQEFAADKKNEMKGAKATGLDKKTLKKDDSISYEAFKQTRATVNSELELDTQQKDNTGQNRKIAGDNVRDVTVKGSVTRAPSAKSNDDDYKVVRPPEMTNSRYIKYDLGDILNDIESATK